MISISSHIKRYIASALRLARLPGEIDHLKREIDTYKVLAGVAASRFPAEWIPRKISEAEFRVFSQYGDDGIIQYLIRCVDPKERIFIEYGVESYVEANTRFLLLKDNWRGLVMDGSNENVANILRQPLVRRHDLVAQQAWVTKDNINQLFESAGFSGKIGLLSIDIDGNDYWVWQAITSVDPAIVIVEYNSVFGSYHPWTTPYHPGFLRSKYHSSNLCYGASITSLCGLAQEKGYAFVGCNSAGNNAYFVKKSQLGVLQELTPEEGFVDATFLESRGPDGRWSGLRGAERLQALKGVKVWNTVSCSEEVIS